MTVLLTGATGFIGQEIYHSQIKDYRCVVRNGSHHAFDDFFEIDGLDSKTNWDNAFQGINVIIHLAGLAHSDEFTNEDFFEVNTQGTLRLASEAVKYGVKRFVFISTIGVINTSTGVSPINEIDTPTPCTGYAESKYKAELGLLKIAKKTGLEVVIVRPTLVYGANAPGNFKRLIKLVCKLPFLPFGLVNNKRSFISVGNLADFIHTCTIHPKAKGETFVISDGPVVSIKGFTNSMANGLRTSIIQLPIPVFLMNYVAKILGKSKLANQLFANLEVNSSKAFSLLDWIPPESMQSAMKKLK